MVNNVDMSPEAISRRLGQTEELRKLALYLKDIQILPRAKVDDPPFSPITDESTVGND